jgi:Fe-S cluster biogenesis protein NfuA
MLAQPLRLRQAVPQERSMVTRERVQTVLDRIRPVLQNDGGDIELLDVIDNRAKVRLTGNCVGCPSAQMTLYFGVESALKEEIPELEELQVV